LLQRHDSRCRRVGDAICDERLRCLKDFNTAASQNAYQPVEAFRLQIVDNLPAVDGACVTLW
jgi:hypothetical protein